MVPLAAAQKLQLRRELEAMLGRGAVLSDPEELLVYESDGLTLFRALADFVVFPTSAQHVSAVVKLANRENLPFVARGAGTGLSGGCLPTEGGIVVSMMRMNRVLEVDYDNQIAVVEPGLVNLHLSWKVGPRGYYYAPDPSSQQACTIGGNIATNSGGPHTLKYGVTANHVVGLEVVMPDGEIVWLGGKTREAPGYDLAGVFVGSEGTFGIATKVVVRILKKPQAVKTVLAVFDHMDRASEAVSAIIGRGLVPAAIEMIDHLTIQAVEDAFNCGYPRDADAALLIELDGLAVELDEERRVGVARVAAVERVLDRLNRQVVDHLDCGRHEPAPDDRRYSRGGPVDLVENREHRLDRLRLLEDADDDLGGNTEGALG